MNYVFFSNLRPGSILFHQFVVERCLSATDLGAVYLCRVMSDPDRVVALKVLSTPASKEEETAASFRREIDLSCKVSHPCVVAGGDLFRDDDFTAFTMEYIEGGSLADYIDREAPFDIDEAVRILKQLSAGVNAIHQAGIIHRDLKPENVLVDTRGNVRISDFGIAVEKGGESDSLDRSSLAEKDAIVGTMNYLSPEYVRSGEFDERSDIYALGVIAYEMITGTLPFESSSLLESLTARVRFDPVSPALVREDCPEWLASLVMKAMNRNPDDRFQSVEELLTNLEEAELRVDEPAVAEPTTVAAVSPVFPRVYLNID